MKKGYRDIMGNCMANAKVLKEGIEKTGRFEVISKQVGVPLVAFSLKDSSKYTVFQIAEYLRRFGWIVPAYNMPPDADHISVLRIVVREDFCRTLAERFVSDIQMVLKQLDESGGSSLTNDSTRMTNIKKEVMNQWRRVTKNKTNGVC